MIGKKITIEVVKCQPNDEKEPKWWDIAFDVNSDSELNAYMPVTIVADNEKDAIAQATKSLHGQITMLLTKDIVTKGVDYFDIMEIPDGSSEHTSVDEQPNDRRKKA